MADEPVLATIPPNGLHDWATHRIASAVSPTAYGVNQLIRSSAQPGALYVRLGPLGSVWAWRPDQLHRPAAVARAGRLRATWNNEGEAVLAAPLGALWLTATGRYCWQDEGRLRTLVLAPWVQPSGRAGGPTLVVLPELHYAFRGK